MVANVGSLPWVNTPEIPRIDMKRPPPADLFPVSGQDPNVESSTSLDPRGLHTFFALQRAAQSVSPIQENPPVPALCVHQEIALKGRDAATPGTTRRARHCSCATPPSPPPNATWGGQLESNNRNAKSLLHGMAATTEPRRPVGDETDRTYLTICSRWPNADGACRP